MALQEEWEKHGQWLFRYRGTAPLIMLLFGMGVYLYGKSHPGSLFLPEGPGERIFEWICLAVSLLGLIIRIYTVGHTPRNTSGRNVDRQVAETLNTTGSYSMVRHPLYVGNFLMWLGPALMTQNVWFVIVFCLVYWIYYERIMFAEEQYLRARFGEPYLQWAGRVPAFLPRFGAFAKPDTPFSWKKVLKKEKNGLAATFLVFFSFSLAADLITDHYSFNMMFAAGSAASVLLYFILKLIKYRTDWFTENR